MEILLIIEGLGLLYCLYSWIRDHPRKRIEWIVSIGKRISGILFRHRYRTINAECCEMMFPEASEEERRRQYMALRVGGLVLCMLIGNAVFLLAVFMDTPAVFPGLNVSRPAYGEDNIILRYQLSAKGKDKTISEEIKIEVPEQQPSDTEIEQQFKEAEQSVRNVFEQFSEDTGYLDLPERYEEILIQ